MSNSGGGGSSSSSSGGSGGGGEVERVLAEQDDPFRVLRLEPSNCSDELANAQFHRIARIVHPDKNTTNISNATEAQKIVTQAKECLLDKINLHFHRKSLGILRKPLGKWEVLLRRGGYVATGLPTTSPSNGSFRKG